MRTIARQLRTPFVTFICALAVLASFSASFLKAQDNNAPPYVLTAFADLSQRLGNTYQPGSGLQGSWNYAQISIVDNNANLGCPPRPDLPVIQGQTAAWQISITLNGIGIFDYRAAMDGSIVFLCSAPPGVNIGSQPAMAQPPAAQTQNPTIYQSPVIAYVEAYSGNVTVTSLGVNPGPTAITGDSSGPDGIGSLSLNTSLVYGELVWSSDGTGLAYWSNNTNPRKLFVANSGQTPMNVASVSGSNFRAAWSPDGSEIAYVDTAVNDTDGSGNLTYPIMAVSRFGGQPRLIGSFRSQGIGGGYLPQDPSDAIYSTDRINSGGILIWTPTGIIHSLADAGVDQPGLGFTSLDGQPVWSIQDVDHVVVSPDQRRAIALQGTQPILIDLATGQTAAFQLPGGPQVMAWSQDGQTLYYSTVSQLSQVQINSAQPGAQLVNGSNPDTMLLSSAVSNNVQLWSIPATGGTPVPLFSMEGYGIADISVSPVSQLVSFSFVSSAVPLFNAINAGSMDIFTLFPTIRIGTIVPGQSPVFWDGGARRPAISPGTQFSAVPAVSAAFGGGGSAPTVCSQPGTTATSFTLVNNTSQPVALIWVDPNCQETQYAVINPGTSVQQQSYTGHAWVIRDTQSSQLLKQFVVTQNDTITVP